MATNLPLRLNPDGDNERRQSFALARKKQWAPKSKKGCINCKTRKVKCDEEKPYCRRCTSTGRKCDGYVAQPSGPSEYEERERCRSIHGNISNIAQRSLSCHACQQRRVKCDLTRPECNRCLRNGQSCTGYRDVRSFHTNDMSRNHRNAYDKEDDSSALVESSSSKLARVRWIHSFEQRCEASLPSKQQSFPLQYTLAESWDNHYMPIVMNKFLFDAAKSVYNAIPWVVSKADEGSALYRACNAVGRAYMANTTLTSRAISSRSTAYGTALSAVNSAICDPQQRKSDNTILGVWLLSLYELLLGARNSIRPSGWDIHSKGLAELLRLRGTEHCATQNGRNLFWVVFNTVQLQGLINCREDPIETSTWVRQIYVYSEPQEYSIIRACIFAHHCNSLCIRIRKLSHEGDHDKILSNSPSILQAIDEVENVTYPLSNEKGITDIVVDPPFAPYEPNDVNIRYVGITSYQCNSRMRLSYDTLVFLFHASKAPSCTPQQRTIFTKSQHTCIEEFRAVANKVLLMMAITLGMDHAGIFERVKTPAKDGDDDDDENSSPAVGWPDTIRVLWPSVQWPLRLIKACPLSSSGQRETANKILESMNEQIGIMQALGTLYASGMQVP